MIKNMDIIVPMAALVALWFALSGCAVLKTKEDVLVREGRLKLDRLETLGCDDQVTPLFLRLLDAEDDGWPALVRVNDEIDAALEQCPGSAS